MDNTALFKLSYGLYVIGTKMQERYTGCIVDAFMQVTSDPVHVVLANINTTNTNKYIKENKEFTISVLPDNVDPFIIANFGFQSGATVDKWPNVEYEMLEGLPVLKNNAAALKCKVIDIKEMSTHTLFTCEVINAWQGEGEPLTYGQYQKSMKTATIEAFKAYQENGTTKSVSQSEETKRCSICGYEYDGDIPFDELPDDWTCPICKQPKKVFE